MLVLIGFTFVAISGRASAQAPDSVLELLPAVDEQRLVDAVEVWSDPPPREAVVAAAQLLWAIERLDPPILEAMAEENSEEDPTASDAGLVDQVRVVEIEGTVESYEAVPVPPELAEVLEFDRFYRVLVRPGGGPDSGDAAVSVRLITRVLPSAWTSGGAGPGVAGADGGVGQPVAVTAVQVGSGADASLFAERLRWIPAAGASVSELPVGWQMLAAEGVDIGRLAEVATRNRQPLRAEDHDPFYAILAAAARIGDAAEPAVAPEPIDTVEMLRDPSAWVGRWVRLDLETARLTRVAIGSPELRQRLGQDSYWQIDAFGQLGDTRIELEAPDGEGEPMVFANRFPVSLAVLELPDWLAEEVQQSPEGGVGEVAIGMVKEPIAVDGFFFRLWSYGSEFTESRGGRQIAPLVLVSKIHSRAAASEAGEGVAAIGWIFAVALIGALVIVAVALWRSGRRDRRIARARRIAAERETLGGPLGGAIGDPRRPPLRAVSPPEDLDRGP